MRTSPCLSYFETSLIGINQPTLMKWTIDVNSPGMWFLLRDSSCWETQYVSTHISASKHLLKMHCLTFNCLFSRVDWFFLVRTSSQTCLIRISERRSKFPIKLGSQHWFWNVFLFRILKGFCFGCNFCSCYTNDEMNYP